MPLVNIGSVYVMPFSSLLNLIFPGVCFNIVLLHSYYNCGINLMVIESKKGGAQCADRAVVFIRI